MAADLGRVLGGGGLQQCGAGTRGDVIKLFLARSSIPGSTYPTVASAFFMESLFDISVGVIVLIFAFTQGVFPKPPDFSQLGSFDISFLARTSASRFF